MENKTTEKTLKFLLLLLLQQWTQAWLQMRLQTAWNQTGAVRGRSLDSKDWTKTSELKTQTPRKFKQLNKTHTGIFPFPVSLPLSLRRELTTHSFLCEKRKSVIILRCVDWCCSYKQLTIIQAIQQQGRVSRNVQNSHENKTIILPEKIKWHFPNELWSETDARIGYSDVKMEIIQTIESERLLVLFKWAAVPSAHALVL